MFDKELFFSLCEKYGVEFSANTTVPQIKKNNAIHNLKYVDIHRILSPTQVQFEYIENSINAKNKKYK